MKGGPGAAPVALDVVSFTLGGCRFALAAEQVRAVLDRMPDTVPEVGRGPAGLPRVGCLPDLLGWQAGAAQPRLRDGLQDGLQDREAGVGLSGCAGRALLVKDVDGDYLLPVGQPVELRTLPAAGIHPLPPLVAAFGTLRGLRGLAWEPDGLTLLLDAGRWR